MALSQDLAKVTARAKDAQARTAAAAQAEQVQDERGTAGVSGVES
jgi:hypothetical protein